MEIYIEVFLIQNILINFCLLRLIEITTKTKATFFKLLLSATIGAVFSVISAIIITNTLVMNLLKITCAAVMLFIAYKQGFKQFVFNLILLFVFTFALGGAVINLSASTYHTTFGLITLTKINLELICLIILSLTYIFQFTLKHIKFKIKTNNLIYKIKLFKNNKSLDINAYLDTGNFLNINGNPVVIVELKTYLKLTNENLLNFYLKPTEQISTSTVTGKSNLKVVMLDKIEIIKDNKTIEIKNQYIAINTANFKNTNYQALLSPMLF